VAESRFDEWMAENYQALWPELFQPEAIVPAVDFLQELAGDGAALELGVGTGRIALPLSRRGVPVHGIELSEAMVAQLRQHEGAGDIGVTLGDFATCKAGEAFAVAYLIRNTITNVVTQQEQVATFLNVASQLRPGGYFVIENYVPELRRLPPGETAHLFAATARHVAYEDYDYAAQIAVSHHFWAIGGELRTFSSPHRYVWPSELDLMARLAELRFEQRWSDWNRNEFTSDSRSHISVWQKPDQP
jgi:Methyltransferase domain